MSTVTRYFCDVCGVEDNKCQAWTIAPTWVRHSDKGISYTACAPCTKIVTNVVEALLRFKNER